jgi:hypothetical protein
MPERELHVEPGHCTCGDVYECVKNRKIKGAPFTKKNWGGWFTSVPGIHFATEVVRWTKGGSTTLHRGLTLDDYKKALDRLYELGYIKAGQYPYPSRFEIVGRWYIVGGNGSRPPQEDMFPVEKLPASKRERWSEPAKFLIARAVRTNAVSPPDIVEQLISGSFRKPGLTEKTLVRQLDRMAPKYYSRSELMEYRKKYLPNSWGPRSPRPEKAEAPKPAPAGSPWNDEQDRTVVEDALSIRITRNGKVNFSRIAKKWRRRRLRKVKTYQTVRQRLGTIAHRKSGPKYGLTMELWHRLNNTKGIRVKKKKEVLTETAPSTPRASFMPDKPVEVDLGAGIKVTASREAQEEALKAYLTKERIKEALLLYFKSHGL